MTSPSQQPHLHQAAQRVDNILEDHAEEKAYLDRMSPQDRRKIEQGAGADTPEKYRTLWMRERVRSWLESLPPDERAYALNDAVDHLLGSEVLDRPDASDEELLAARRAITNREGARLLLEILEQEIRNPRLLEAGEEGEREVRRDVVRDALERIERRRAYVRAVLQESVDRRANGSTGH